MSAKPSLLKGSISAVAIVDLANELVERRVIEPSDLNSMGESFLCTLRAWKSGHQVQESRLPEELLISLWQKAATGRSGQDIGLKIGAKVNLSARGLLANWLAQCETLSEAFNIFSANISLLNPSECWTKTEEDKTVKLTVKFLSGSYPSMAIDRSMAALVSWSEELSGTKLTPLKISIMSNKPSNPAAYFSLLGKNLSFNQPENAIWLTNEQFNRSIPNGNAYLKTLLANQVEGINQKQSNAPAPPFSMQVKSLLRKSLTRYCQLPEICLTLHVSRSTLYRKLKSEGVSFTELVRDIRLERIVELERALPNRESIADALGFNDASSFYRFKKLNT
jgi:AraC-like DNA-binding protein